MRFFESLFGNQKAQPEDAYLVTVTKEMVRVEHPKRKTEVLYWDDLQTVLLINTDAGPWQPDVWLALVGHNSGCTIPQGAAGYDKVYDHVSKYDGFNFENAILSMSRTENKEFLLWTNEKEQDQKCST